MTDEGKRTLTGGCHCGAVRFRVTASLERVLACNCSLCRMKGFLHVIVDDEADLELLLGEDALTAYTFGTHTARHLFCKVCGVQSFYKPRSHPEGWSVNARCVDGVDLEALRIEPFDGANWERNVGSIR